jgi:hypothetical protein
LLVTVPALAVNEAVVALATTLTDAGTVNDELLSAKVTVEPPAGAALESVTLQVEVPADGIDIGVHNKFVIVSDGVTVTEVVADAPLKLAVIVTV